MKQIVFCTYGHSPALVHARNRLEAWGYTVSANPAEATHLLLPVPSFDENGNVKGGGKLSELLPKLRPDVIIFGGNLDFVHGKKADFLKDEFYLVENAAITAQCAMKLISISQAAPVLVIGWGRIGKHLAELLRSAGAAVTVAVRRESQFTAVTAQGYTAVYMSQLQPKQYRIIFNTAPALVLHQEDAHPDARLIDLASKKGIFGDRVIWARGLPGKDAPENSGTLIAKTALRYTLEGGIGS